MSFDVLIRNGLVVDGTGDREPFFADIAIQGDRIAAVGRLGDTRAEREIDALGHVVCPGFVDVHVHCEPALLTGSDRFAGVVQGITTQLLAPDGFGWAPLPPDLRSQMWEYTRFAAGGADIELTWETIEDYLNLYPGNSPCNVYPQVPHCAVRLNVCGWSAGPATDSQIDAMADLVRQWMEAGAGCLCLGLDYQPSANSDLRELVELCKVAASCGGIYAAHIRNHILGRPEAWKETFEIFRRSGIPVHLSHERADREGAELLELAEREDVDLSFESYLYPAGMSHMTIMLPVEDQVGAPSDVLEHLADPAVKQRILPHLRGWLGACNQVVGHTRSGRYVGATLSDLAARAGVDPEDFAYDLILEEEGLSTYVFPWQDAPEINENTIKNTVTHPRMMLASDGIYNVRHPHPRGFGCFARVPGVFVREKKWVSLAEAIHKMSGFPARRFGLSDRGEIAAGKAADVVIFDPQTINATATFENPRGGPVGIQCVLVNGKPAVEGGAPTGALPGRVLHRNASSSG